MGLAETGRIQRILIHPSNPNVVWASANRDVGSGKQTITAYEPPKHVASDLDLNVIKAQASWDLDTYVGAVVEALDVVQTVAGTEQAHALGRPRRLLAARVEPPTPAR